MKNLKRSKTASYLVLLQEFMFLFKSIQKKSIFALSSLPQDNCYLAGISGNIPVTHLSSC